MKDLIKGNKRLTELDSLRGLASLTVFLSHAFGMVTLSGTFSQFNHSSIRVFWDGAAAVILFFVLSGFVLTLPYIGEKAQKLEIFPFLIRRIFRIYPAYFVVIMLSLMLKYFIFEPEGLKGLSSWITSFWQSPYTSIYEIMKHIIMIGLNHRELNPVVWTLVIEMKISLIFPFVIIMIRRINSFKNSLLFLIVFLLLGYIVKGIFEFLPLFVIGAVLAKYCTDLSNLIQKQYSLIKCLIFIVGITLYGFRYTFFGLIENETTINYLIGCGTSIIIILIISTDKLRYMLSLKALRILGNISYSFYLLHFPILLTCTSYIYLKTNIIISWLISLCVTLIASFILHKIVEIPCQNIGKRLSLLLVKNAYYKKNNKAS